jgi:hypothetical protein
MNEVAEVKLPGRPSQIRFKRPAQMELFAKVVCFPPLGQLTVLGRAQREVRNLDDLCDLVIDCVCARFILLSLLKQASLCPK